MVVAIGTFRRMELHATTERNHQLAGWSPSARRRALITVVWLMCAAAPALGQDLSGTWRFRPEMGDQLLLVLEQDSLGNATGSLSIGELRFEVRGVVEGGLLRGTMEGEEIIDRFTARLLGTSLLWQVEGSDAEYAFQSVDDPAPRPEADARAAGGDRFAGTWIGAGVRLVLEGESGTYAGTVTIAGEIWSILARANGTVLVCTVVGKGEAGRLTGVLSGDALMLLGSAASALLHRMPPDSGEMKRPS
jgi:hypothetical protein